MRRTEPGAHELERARGALELMGVDVAADHHGGALGHPQIALTQRHPLPFGQIGQLLDRAVGEPRVAANPLRRSSFRMIFESQ
jgi:hypothetical protein